MDRFYNGDGDGDAKKKVKKVLANDKVVVHIVVHFSGRRHARGNQMLQQCGGGGGGGNYSPELFLSFLPVLSLLFCRKGQIDVI